MSDGKSMSADEMAATGQSQATQDFSNVQGFQVVASEVRANGDGAKRDEKWREALRLELEARAARFHQSVDASLVLANDSAIRWLGEPIAKLTPGPDLLTPRAVILADDALPEGARDIIAARLELFLAATTRRLLGPLFALRSMQDEPDAVRDLARKIAQYLGIVDRDPIRNQIRGLNQDARATLRKHGVRFGAYYIYVPAVLKPAARVLALQLWGLQTPGVSADALAQTLTPLAMSGRTSLPNDHLISRENYRVAGFRPCGDRIVRVDIVERLADMIRACFTDCAAKDDSGRVRQGLSRAFVVNGQMTSLTGCSGEHFASILRSLGFECVEMKRSDFGVSPVTEARSLAGASAPGDVSEHESPATEDAILAAQGPALDPPECPAVALQEGPKVAETDAETASRETPVGDIEPERESQPEPAFVATATAPSASDSTVEKTSVLTDMIAVWRPAQRLRAHGRKARPVRRPGKESPARAPSGAPPQDDEQSRKDGHSSEGDEPASRGSAPPPASRGAAGARAGVPDPMPAAERPNMAHTGKKRRQSTVNRGMVNPRSNSGTQERMTIDPNSPFAKLAELRSLLEARSKDRL